LKKEICGYARKIEKEEFAMKFIRFFISIFFLISLSISAGCTDQAQLNELKKQVKELKEQIKNNAYCLCSNEYGIISLNN
jgi:hypothetical protein